VTVQIRLPGKRALKSSGVLRSEGRTPEISGRYDESARCLVVDVKLPEVREYAALLLQAV
jgi:hypothetical protein